MVRDVVFFFNDDVQLPPGLKTKTENVQELISHNRETLLNHTMFCLDFFPDVHWN